MFEVTEKYLSDSGDRENYIIHTFKNEIDADRFEKYMNETQKEAFGMDRHKFKSEKVDYGIVKFFLCSVIHHDSFEAAIEFEKKNILNKQR